jgi:hypothetical protein
MSILANVRELLDAVLPPAQATATQATPVAPAMPTGTIPRKKRNQVLIAGGAVVLVIGFFIFHRPAAQEPVVRSRSQNTQPTTTLTPEQVTQSGVQLANDTRVAIEHENQLKNLSVAQFGNDPANTGMVDPNTGQRMNSNAQEAANYQNQAPAQTGPTPEQLRHERETLLAKASMRVRTFHQLPCLVTRNLALLKHHHGPISHRMPLLTLQRGLRPPR